MLISETHFIKKSYVKIPFYSIYETHHPSNKARGGSAVIIRSSIKHHELPKIKQENFQVTTISINDCKGPINIAAIYCPPKFNNKKEQFEEIFNTLSL